MFDIGFWELALVGLVALLVVGPERLPRLARTVGLWIGKGRRFVSTVKADIERELKAEELKRILDEQARSNPLEEIVEETREGLGEIERETAKTVGEARDQLTSRNPTAAKGTDDGSKRAGQS